MQKLLNKSLSHVLNMLIVFVLASCSSDDDPSHVQGSCESSTASTVDIEGVWEVFSIEGVSNLNPPQDYSTLSFTNSGDYVWMANIDTQSFAMQVNTAGAYSFDGTLLTINGGGLESSVEVNPIQLAFCENNNKFSYLDEFGDRWMYKKTQNIQPNNCQPGTTSAENIEGNWFLSSIEGIPDLNLQQNFSELVFFNNGNYVWTASIDTQSLVLDVNTIGTYSFDGSLLTITSGSLENSIEANPVELNFCNNDTKFSYRDEFGDRWTYENTPPN